MSEAESQKNTQHFLRRVGRLFSWLCEIGIDGSVEPQLAARVRFLNALVTYVFFLFVPAIVSYVVNQQYLMILTIVPWMLVFGAIFWLNSRKSYQASRGLFLAVVNASIIFVCWLFGNDINFDLLYFPIMVLPFMLYRKNDLVSILSYCALTVGLYCTVNFSEPLWFAGVLKLPDSVLRSFQVIFEMMALFTTAAMTSILFYFERQYVVAAMKEREEFFKLEKLASLGMVSAEIAHEVNNPLAIIEGQVEVLLTAKPEKLKDTEFVSKRLGTISRQTQRIATIVRSMLAFARDGQLDALEIRDLSRMVDEALGLCQEIFGKHQIKIIWEGSQSLLPVACRPVEFQQVLVNLLNNARDALEKRPGAWIRISLQTKSDRVYLRVEDSGSIPEDLRDKIGQAFFTTKRSGKGTGLGLSLSMQIIERIGGRLYLERDRVNTSFMIDVPLASSRELGPKASSPAKAS